MEINEVFRHARLQRRVSQTKLAKGISARSTLTSFEKNGTCISYYLLRQYLARLNIKIDEFEYLLQLDQDQDKNLLSKRLREAYRDKQYLEMQDLAEACLIRYRETKDFYYYHLYAQNMLILNRDGQLTISPRKLTLIKDHLEKYLTRLDYWGRFEFSVFINVMDIFDLDFIEGRLVELEKYREQFRPIDREYKLYSKAILNVLNVARQRGLLQEYAFLAEDLKKDLGPRDFYEQMRCDYFLALAAIERNGDEEAIQLVKDDLAFIRRRGNHDLAEEMVIEGNRYIGRKVF